MIEIAAYDPEWPLAFRRIGGHILAALASLPARVEHVGSTAVPGLAAKPILDIDIVVPAMCHLAAAIKALASIGYAHRGDLGITGREAFAAPLDGEVAHHLYLVVDGNAAHRDHVDFRDYLTAHPARAAEYAALKVALAARHGDDRAAYTEAKAPFILATLAAARGAREAGTYDSTSTPTAQT